MTHYRLLADIGGTHARFALLDSAGGIDKARVLACAHYTSLADAMQAYLDLPSLHGQRASVRGAAIAIANPIDGDQVSMTNHHWSFSMAALRKRFQFDQLLVVNDFQALAQALPHLGPNQRMQVGGGQAQAGSVIGVLGPGTGLGAAALVPHGSGWIAVDGEGGHVTLAPASERELDILRFAWREFEHVSAERLISGIGLQLMYRAIAARNSAPAPAVPGVPEIVSRAVAGECAVSVETMDSFCCMLGTIAGNMALTLGARGGIYIGGGIVPRLGGRFASSGFRQRFEQKGRFASYLAKIPTYVITAGQPCFLGLRSMLDDRSAALPLATGGACHA
jgi:glucokinase